MKKRLFRIFAVLSSAIALVILIFFTRGTGELVRIISTMKYRWVAVAFFCMLMYWVMDSLIIHSVTGALFKYQKYFNSLKVTMIGQFFSAITTFASGGQPAQAYVMIKDGVKPGHAVSVLVIKSTLYQSVLAAYSLLMVATSWGFFVQKVPHFFLIYFVGFSLNIIAVMIYILSLTRKDIVYKIIELVFAVLSRIKLLKNLEKFETKLEHELESFVDGVAALKYNYWIIIKSTVFQILQLTFYFSIVYFIYLSIETTHINPWYIIASQGIILVGAQIVPLPGSTGGAEGLSYLFCSMFFKPDSVIPVILIWRIVTYYSSIVFGGLVSSLAPEKPLHAK
jgi:uncharacterized protein (TIRG00374 family)